MDEHMKKLQEDFITQRVNFHGRNEAQEANDAFMLLREKTERLEESLTDEQRLLLRACKNAYHIADGESNRYYYTAGLNDAILFLTDWMKK